MGADQDTVAWPPEGTAVTFVGAPGTVSLGVSEMPAEGSEFPTAFVATTVNVYAWPFVKPVTVAVVAAPVAVNPPGLEVTV